jgi:hypothetical protein
MEIGKEIHFFAGGYLHGTNLGGCLQSQTSAAINIGSILFALNDQNITFISLVFFSPQKHRS